MKIRIKAFSLIELLVSITIASVVITLALGTVGSVYFTQKRTELSQSFYAETRLLMEQIVQIIRNNTIDYDSYFIEMGPNSDLCESFDSRQVLKGGSLENNDDNRALYAYESVFYWDTNDDGVPDRNLGGYDQGDKDSDSENDPCTQAFYGTQDVLYVINGSRTRRVQIRADQGRIKIIREIAIDEDGDLRVDRWTSNVQWNLAALECLDVVSSAKVLGEQSVGICENIHGESSISPSAILIKNLKFSLAPDRDPFLAFRNNEVQVHPYVFISLVAELNKFADYGFNEDQKPILSFQTSASSRVFGDPR